MQKEDHSLSRKLSSVDIAGRLLHTQKVATACRCDTYLPCFIYFWFKKMNEEYYIVKVEPKDFIEKYEEKIKQLKEEKKKQTDVVWKEIYSIWIKDKELYIDVINWKLKIEKYREIKNYLDWFYHGLTHEHFNILIDEYNYYKQKSDMCKKFNINF